MFIDGTYSILYIDVKDGSGMLPVGCTDSNSFNESTESIDSTTTDNEGWSTNRLTNQSYSIGFNGLVLSDSISFTKATYYNLKVAKRDRTLIDWALDDTDYGSGYITELSDERGIDENVSFSAELQGYGKPIIKLDFIYESYETRVLADGGVMGNEKCLKNYIDSLL